MNGNTLEVEGVRDEWKKDKEEIVEEWILGKRDVSDVEGWTG